MTAAMRINSVTTNGTNPFTGKPCVSQTLHNPSVELVKSLLMKQQQIICKREGDKHAKIADLHMVITGVRPVTNGANVPGQQNPNPYNVVGFSILPDNYGELLTSIAPSEIYVTNSGELEISAVRRINHFHKIAAVKWLGVIMHGGVKTVVKAHELEQNAEGLFFYKIPGSTRKWHGTHFIIDPEQTKASTRMMLRMHADQLMEYVNPLERGSLIHDKHANEYIVLQTFPPRDVNGKYVDMLIVNGSMGAPTYAFSYEFETFKAEAKQ